MQKKSNLDYHALKYPIFSKKIKWETEDVIETKDKFLQDTHRIIVGNNRTKTTGKQAN